MKKTILNSLFLLCFILGYGQELPTIVPPSPELASLGKYIDIPVSLSTGVPNISIPIFDLKGKSINFPISLSYHASGIRVNEIASRNGLGWTLNAGGVITRSIRGIPDDSKDGYINTTNSVSAYEKADKSKKNILFNGALDNNFDFESDVYYYNFLGKSGKFFFNQKNNKIIFHPKTDMKIAFRKDLNKKIIGWSVKTPDGITFEFGFEDSAIKKESNTTYINDQNLPSFNPSALTNYTSSWYLTKVIDTFGNETSFTYHKETNHKISVWNISNHSKEFKSIYSISNGNPASTGKTLTFTKNEYSPIFLKEIKNSYGKIELSYDEERLDLINDKALTNIALYNRFNKLIDNYDLKYKYFESIDKNQYPNFGIDQQLRKRIYLDKVVQKLSNKENKSYLLTYNTDHILPNRFSFSQDFWGYFNGIKNTALYPEIEIIKSNNIFKIDGANRKINTEFVKACTLKSITYPTKGKTEFLFESNSIGSNNEKAFFVGNNYKNSLIKGGQLGNQIGFNEVGKTYSSNFKIEREFPFSGIVDYQIYLDKNCNNSNNDCVLIQITKPDNSVVWTFESKNDKGSIYLPIGEYTLKIKNGFFQTDNNVNINLYGRSLLPEQENALTGGLRIKKILFKDLNNSVKKRHIYNYNLFDNINKSSGQTLNPPIFYYKRIPYSLRCPSCVNDKIQSSAIFPLNGQSSSHVTYTNVSKVLHENGKGNGKIESVFSYTSDSKINSSNTIGFEGSEFPLVPSLDYSHRRGILTKEKIYNAKNEIQQETTYNYNSLLNPEEVNDTSTNYRAGRIGDYVGFVSYRNISERLILTNKTLKTFNQNNSTQQTINYIYDNGYDGRSFPIKTVTHNSKEESITTETKYAHDTNNERLKNEHRISEPLEIKTYKNNIELNKQNTIYENFEGLYLPKKIQSSKGEDQQLEDNVIYHNYDHKGNPIEVSKANGTHIVYLWGYNYTQPVAKIENATLTDIPKELKTKITDLSDNDKDESSEQTLREWLAKLRIVKGLKKAQITCYTYDPLVGLTSITDPRGKTVYYEYDDFNRLQFIKNSENKILKEYQYNYKN